VQQAGEGACDVDQAEPARTALAGAVGRIPVGHAGDLGQGATVLWDRDDHPAPEPSAVGGEAGVGEHRTVESRRIDPPAEVATEEQRGGGMGFDVVEELRDG
jgi:hypothetical protein